MSTNLGTSSIDGFMVGALMAEKLMVGANLVWQRSSPPSAITDFSASTGQIDQITVTFSSATGEPVPTYDLYENVGPGTLITSGITSGYVHSTTTASKELYVKAVNSAGSTASNMSTGTTSSPAGSQTFTASGNFVVPRGYTSVNVCLCGAGGSGSSANFGSSSNEVDRLGGRGGAHYSGTVSVTAGENISVIIGSGGAAQTITSTKTSKNGVSGGSSSFGSATASGGAGGNYSGNGGGSSTVCGGTRYDGARSAISNGGEYSYGGQKGMYGNGGRGNKYANGYGGGIGAGGAGAFSTGNMNFGVSSGAGGRGQCVITWS